MCDFKSIIEEERQNMPDYQFDFLYHKVMPGFFFVVGGAIVSLILGVILYSVIDIVFISLIPVIIWAIITIILLVLFVIYNRKYTNMLIDDKTKEFEERFKLIDYEQAIKKLEDKKIIVKDNLIIGNEQFSRMQYKAFFNSVTFSGAYYFKLEIYNMDDEPLMILDLDKFLCTYFVKNIDLIENNEIFELFINDKKKFLEYLLKFNDINKMQKQCIKDKELCFDREKNLKDKFGFLLDEYGFKFKKSNLGNLLDKNGELIFYGPLNCYQFYTENICINFLNLVQREDWNIYITNDVYDDQLKIYDGLAVDSKYAYNKKLFATRIKKELNESHQIFGHNI